jgi:hypothetical protein
LQVPKPVTGIWSGSDWGGAKQILPLFLVPPVNARSKSRIFKRKDAKLIGPSVSFDNAGCGLLQPKGPRRSRRRPFFIGWSRPGSGQKLLLAGWVRTGGAGLLCVARDHARGGESGVAVGHQNQVGRVRDKRLRRTCRGGRRRRPGRCSPGRGQRAAARGAGRRGSGPCHVPARPGPATRRGAAADGKELRVRRVAEQHVVALACGRSAPPPG